jgi:2-polyprenyl-6-methoxyphenol hydroxylase-like FAD-dependent oxidoreductase
VVGVRGHGRDEEQIVARAEVVVGADGRFSRVAEAVDPPRYHEKPPLLALYYSYWSGIPMEGRFEQYLGLRRGFAAAPTHDDLTLIVGGWPYDEFEANKRDALGNYLAIMESTSFAPRLRRGRRETKLHGACIPNFFRTPYGPGWALVGDAGYIKDPITAQGITDAFLDAERCAAALDRSLRGARPFAEAMESYRRERDEHALPMYEMTVEVATLEPPPPETQQLLAAIRDDQAAMDDFARMNAGTISPAEFFAPEHVAELMAPRPHLEARAPRPPRDLRYRRRTGRAAPRRRP